MRSPCNVSGFTGLSFMLCTSCYAERRHWLLPRSQACNCWNSGPWNHHLNCMEGHQARVNLAMYLSLAGHHMNSFRESSSLSQTEVCTASLTQTDTDPPDILLTLFLTAHVGCYKLTFPNAPMTFFSGEQQTKKIQVCHTAAITKEYIRCKCCNCICSFLHENSRRE